MLASFAPTLKTVSPEVGNEGIPWWIFAVVAGSVVLVGGIILVLALRKQSSAAVEMPCRKCGRILMPEWPQCMFCKTPRELKNAAIEFVSGPMLGRTVNLDGDVTSIGTAPGSTVVLEDQGVSRKHAGIRKADGGYELADLGSTNGVYVNGEKVAGKKRLQVGDVIRIGTTEIVFKS